MLYILQAFFMFMCSYRCKSSGSVSSGLCVSVSPYFFRRDTFADSVVCSLISIICLRLEKLLLGDPSAGGMSFLSAFI